MGKYIQNASMYLFYNNAESRASVWDPDPDGSEIICKLRSGSESVIIFGFGFEPGSKRSSVSN
jgi:hypothetical protein